MFKIDDIVTLTRQWIDIEASGEINASRTHSDCLDHTHTFLTIRTFSAVFALIFYNNLIDFADELPSTV